MAGSQCSIIVTPTQLKFLEHKDIEFGKQNGIRFELNKLILL